jgi:hypothetical protein
LIIRYEREEHLDEGFRQRIVMGLMGAFTRVDEVSKVLPRVLPDPESFAYELKTNIDRLGSDVLSLLQREDPPTEAEARRAESLLAAADRMGLDLVRAAEATALGDELKGLPVLSEQEQMFRDILLKQAPHDALTGPSVCNRYLERVGSLVDESDFRSRIVPRLKKWGLLNEAKRGYYFPADSAARRVSRI